VPMLFLAGCLVFSGIGFLILVPRLTPKEV
jgi:hypothetical protein